MKTDTIANRFIMFLLICLVLLIFASAQSEDAHLERTRNEIRQEAVEHGYGAWVLTNGSKTFIWNEQRWLYKMDGVKYQTDFKYEQ